MILGVLVVGWLVCAAIAAGVYFAYLQDAYPTIAREDYRKDIGRSWLFGLMGGPLSLLTAMLMTGFAEHGIRWK